MKIVNYCDAKVPTWALSYLVNNDASGITEEDKQQVDSWHARCIDALRAENPSASFDFFYSEQEGSFTHRPAFGLATDAIDAAVVALVNNDEPGESMRLPWEEEDEESTTDDDTLLPGQAEQLIKEAEEIGVAHGENAADWFEQDAFGGRCTRNHKENAQRILDAIDEGDPAFWDGINLPNLSGEYADDMTTRDLARIVCDRCRIDHDNVPPEVEDEISTAYENGVGTGFVDRITSLARACVED